MFMIPAKGGNHTPEFADGAGTLEAHKRAMNCAAGMAVVACHFFEDDGFAKEVEEDFRTGPLTSMSPGY